MRILASATSRRASKGPQEEEKKASDEWVTKRILVYPSISIALGGLVIVLSIVGISGRGGAGYRFQNQCLVKTS